MGLFQPVTTLLCSPHLPISVLTNSCWGKISTMGREEKLYLGSRWRIVSGLSSPSLQLFCQTGSPSPESVMSQTGRDALHPVGTWIFSAALLQSFSLNDADGTASTHQLSVLHPLATVPLVEPQPLRCQGVVIWLHYRGDCGEAANGQRVPRHSLKVQRPRFTGKIKAQGWNRSHDSFWNPAQVKRDASPLSLRWVAVFTFNVLHVLQVHPGVAIKHLPLVWKVEVNLAAFVCMNTWWQKKCRVKISVYSPVQKSYHGSSTENDDWNWNFCFSDRNDQTSKISHKFK